MLQVVVLKGDNFIGPLSKSIREQECHADCMIQAHTCKAGPAYRLQIAEASRAVQMTVLYKALFTFFDGHFSDPTTFDFDGRDDGHLGPSGHTRSGEQP